MPRNRIRKTDRTRKSSEEMLTAIKDVVEKGSSIRKASKVHGIAKSHLAREVANFKKLPNGEYKYDSLVGNRRVFNPEQEEELAKYLLKASEHNHGFTSLQTRKLAYDFAVGCESQNIPLSWVTNEQAGKDWFLGFMERNREHFGRKNTNSVKKSKATSQIKKSDETSLVTSDATSLVISDAASSVISDATSSAISDATSSAISDATSSVISDAKSVVAETEVTNKNPEVQVKTEN